MTSFARHPAPAPAPAPDLEWLVVNIACVYTCIRGLQHFIHAYCGSLIAKKSTLYANKCKTYVDHHR